MWFKAKHQMVALSLRLHLPKSQSWTPPWTSCCNKFCRLCSRHFSASKFKWQTQVGSLKTYRHGPGFKVMDTRGGRWNDDFLGELEKWFDSKNGGGNSFLGAANHTCYDLFPSAWLLSSGTWTKMLKGPIISPCLWLQRMKSGYIIHLALSNCQDKHLADFYSYSEKELGA